MVRYRSPKIKRAQGIRQTRSGKFKSKAGTAAYRTPSENEERLRLAMEAAEIGSWHMDLRTGMGVWSAKARQLLGAEPDAPMSFALFLERIHPDDQPRVKEAIRQSTLTRNPSEFEFRVVWPDSSVHWLFSKGTGFYAPDGVLLSRDGIVYDITDRKRQELRLQESEARMQAQYRGIPIPTYTWQWNGSDFVLIDFNTAAETISRGKIQDLLGITAQVLYRDTPDIIEDLGRCYGERVTIQKEITYQLRATRNDKESEEKEFAVSYVYVPDDLVMVHTQDITEEKRLADQFHQAQKMEGIGRLAGGIAHDFNNLLSIILGYSELTEFELPEDSPLRANIRTMVDAARRAGNLTRQLLSFARRQPMAPRVIDPNEHIESMTRMLRPLIGEDIELLTDLEPSVGHVCIDPGHLEQVLVNLVMNARDAMPDGGKVTLRTMNHHFPESRFYPQFTVPAGNYVHFFVIDTGTGMSEETRSRVFEPFFTTKEMGRGTGLGLASAYGIVKQNDGFICVESTLGKGTTFHVYLPIVPITEKAKESTPDAHSPLTAPFGNETILLVEDETLLREMAALTLRRSGYQVLEAANGAEALLISGAYPGTIHLLVTDAIMPQMGGKELAEQLQPLRPNMRILLASGYTPDRFTGNQALPPNMAFLAKPFTPSILTAKVQEILKESS